jgi:hypothetical protein
MKKFRIYFVLLATAVLAACVKMPANQYGPTSNGQGYTLIANGIANQSSITLNVNQDLIMSVKDSLSNTAIAQIDFGNGQSLIGSQVASLYTTPGTYHLTATVLNISRTVKFNITVTVNNSSSSSFTLKLDGATITGDTAYVQTNSNFAPTVVDQTGKVYAADYYYGNGMTNLGATNPNVIYPLTGKYLLTAIVRSVTPNVSLSKYVVAQGPRDYTVKINDVTIANGSTFKTSVGFFLNFSTVDKNGISFTSDFDFGNGSKVRASGMGFSYATTGTYTVTVTTNGQITTFKIEVGNTVVTSDAIRIIETTHSSSNNTVTIGLRCDAIASLNTANSILAEGEALPSVTWFKNTLTSSNIVTIGGVNYYKWVVTIPNAYFRFGWHQDNNWGYTPSIYKRSSDDLYGFRVTDGVISVN